MSLVSCFVSSLAARMQKEIRIHKTWNHLQNDFSYPLRWWHRPNGLIFLFVHSSNFYVTPFNILVQLPLTWLAVSCHGKTLVILTFLIRTFNICIFFFPLANSVEFTVLKNMIRYSTSLIMTSKALPSYYRHMQLSTLICINDKIYKWDNLN